MDTREPVVHVTQVEEQLLQVLASLKQLHESHQSREQELMREVERLSLELEEESEPRQDDALRTHLQQLQQHIHSPRFWTREMAAVFSMELEQMEVLQQEGHRGTERSLLDVGMRWQQEWLEGVSDMERTGFDTERAERLRRIVLAQWVYLRWLEVTHLLQENED